MAAASSDLGAEIEEAVSAVRRGGLVIFPTETVYGVGADPANDDAVGRIFALKQRPRTQALSLHLGNSPELERWADDVPEGARRLAERFWPGPLTLVVPSRDEVSEVVRGGRPTVGLRVPDHPAARELIDRCGGALAGTSANRHGGPSPTTASEAVDALAGAIDAVVDAGPTELGRDSTVLDLSVHPAVVLRAGALAPADIESVLGEGVE